MSWIDLHMHSSCSDDAEFSPDVLMERCHSNGVRMAALADHNSTAGVAKAKKKATELGMELVPAIELDCDLGPTHLHVLGYYIDPAYAPFAQIEEELLAQEQKNAAIRMRLVRQLGIAVDEAEVMRRSPNGAVPGELIAEVALEDPANNGNPLLADYRPGQPYGDSPFIHFYWNICAPGKPADVPSTFLTLSEAVGHIHAAGGIAVLAHPGNNIHEDETLLRSIVAAGVRGVEAFSSYHSPEQVAFYREKARELDLCVTCGSDFHGKTKPTIEVGGTGADGLEETLLAGIQKKLALQRG